MVYLFCCPAGQEVAGCVKAFVVSCPFTKPEQVQMQNGQTTMRNVMDRAAAFRWALSVIQKPFPPGVTFEPYNLNPVPNPQERTPQVLCIEITEAAAVSRVNPGVTYQDPTGNRGAPLTLPPQAGSGGRSDYEDLPDAALAANSDPMVGDIDAAGGTFTDIELNGGMTVERARPADGRQPIRPRNVPSQ